MVTSTNEQLAKMKKSEGLGRDGVLSFLKERDVTLIEAVKIIRSIYKVDISQARGYLYNHPQWKSSMLKSLPLQKVFEQQFLGEFKTPSK